jgi:hypothetical protein
MHKAELRGIYPIAIQKIRDKIAVLFDQLNQETRRTGFKPVIVKLIIVFDKEQDIELFIRKIHSSIKDNERYNHTAYNIVAHGFPGMQQMSLAQKSCQRIRTLLYALHKFLYRFDLWVADWC